MTPYILNLIDLALTLYALANGGVELNPLMQSVPVMVGWKVVGVGIGCALLCHFAGAGNKVARWGLRFCTLVYGALCVYHLFFIFGGA